MVLSLKKDVNIKFSIIIPAHNVGEYLRATIESALSQTYRNIEVICVDDASTDNTKSIIEEFVQNDARVHGVFSEKNGGCVSARKQGIEKAKGDYILFLDGDDELAENACETLLPYLLEDDTPDILQFSTMCVHSEDLSRTAEDNMNTYLNNYEIGWKFDDLLVQCFVDHRCPETVWNKAFKAELLKKVSSQFSEKLILNAEDVYIAFFVLYYAHSYRGIKTEPLYRYYYGRGIAVVLDTNKWLEKLNQQIVVFKEIEEFLKTHNLFESYADIYNAIRDEFIRKLTEQWFALSESDKRETPCSIRDTWGTKDILLSVSSQPDICRGIKSQWYFDFGYGCSEENSKRIVYPITLYGAIQQSIVVPKGCKILRWDPTAGPCVLSNLRIWKDNDMPLAFTPVNAFQYNDILIFQKSDPQILIDFGIGLEVDTTIYLSGDIHMLSAMELTSAFAKLRKRSVLKKLKSFFRREK